MKAYHKYGTRVIVYVCVYVCIFMDMCVDPPPPPALNPPLCFIYLPLYLLHQAADLPRRGDAAGGGAGVDAVGGPTGVINAHGSCVHSLCSLLGSWSRWVSCTHGSCVHCTRVIYHPLGGG